MLIDAFFCDSMDLMSLRSPYLLLVAEVSYNFIKNCIAAFSALALFALEKNVRFLKLSLFSLNILNTVFFPIPKKFDVESHPVRACTAGSMLSCTVV